MKVAFFFKVVVTMIMASTASYSATLKCERTSNNAEGYRL